MNLIIHPEKYPVACDSFKLDSVHLTAGSVALSEADAAIVQGHPDFEVLKSLGAIVIAEELPFTDPPPPADPELPDLSVLNAEESIAAIKQIGDRTALELLLEAEQSGKKRSTVINAINEQLGD